MFLAEQANKLKKKPTYISAPGTIDRIFETHKNLEKDGSGRIPVIIKLEPEEKKRRNPLT